MSPVHLMAATSSRTNWAWLSDAWPTANDDDGPRFSELMSS
jgi:hypothetical protein